MLIILLIISLAILHISERQNFSHMIMEFRKYIELLTNCMNKKIDNLHGDLLSHQIKLKKVQSQILSDKKSKAVISIQKWWKKNKSKKKSGWF